MLLIIGVRVLLILLSFSSDNKSLIASYFYEGEDTCWAGHNHHFCLCPMSPDKDIYSYCKQRFVKGGTDVSVAGVMSVLTSLACFCASPPYTGVARQRHPPLSLCFTVWTHAGSCHRTASGNRGNWLTLEACWVMWGDRRFGLRLRATRVCLSLLAHAGGSRQGVEGALAGIAGWITLMPWATEVM